VALPMLENLLYRARYWDVIRPIGDRPIGTVVDRLIRPIDTLIVEYDRVVCSSVSLIKWLKRDCTWAVDWLDAFFLGTTFRSISHAAISPSTGLPRYQLRSYRL
jgi:hypothetical protein